MKVLITGAAGFIGSHMAERLARDGAVVVGVDNFSDYYDPALKRQNARETAAVGVETIEMDLAEKRSYDALPLDFDFILHFAAQPGISAGTSAGAYIRNNLEATRLLVDFAGRQSALKHFFNMGTSSVYGAYAMKAEDRVPEPTSQYGVTKLAAEQWVLAEARKGRLRASSLRLYSVYGPRERPDKLYTRLIKAGLEGSVFPLFEGSFKHKRSFTFVGDIVDGIALAMDRHEALDGEIINLGSDEQHTTEDGLRTVENALGVKIRTESFPPRDGDQVETRAEISKARKLLGYRPRTSLADGIARQIAWYRKISA